MTTGRVAGRAAPAERASARRADEFWDPNGHAEGVNELPEDHPTDPAFDAASVSARRPGPEGAPAAGHRPSIVYLDPHHRRQVSPYSPEGEIQMMGDFAAGLRNSGRVSRPMIYALVAIILLPIVVSLVAVLSTYW